MKLDSKTKQAARKFVEYWTFRRGSEKGEDQQFWNSLLRDVPGITDVERHIQYQVAVPMKSTTKFLDARNKSKEQAADMESVFGADWKSLGNLDYVTAWHKKAMDLLATKNTKATKAAFVSPSHLSSNVSRQNIASTAQAILDAPSSVAAVGRAYELGLLRP